jgi:hypothetical protein
MEMSVTLRTLVAFTQHINTCISIKRIIISVPSANVLFESHWVIRTCVPAYLMPDFLLDHIGLSHYFVYPLVFNSFVSEYMVNCE